MSMDGGNPPPIDIRPDAPASREPMTQIRPFLAAALAALALFTAAPSYAEVKEVRISKGFGILYLPLFIMQDQNLLEKQAAKAGLGEVKTSWLVVDGGNLINDA